MTYYHTILFYIVWIHSLGYLNKETECQWGRMIWYVLLVGVVASLCRVLVRK